MAERTTPLSKRTLAKATAMYRRRAKRSLDLILTSATLVVWGPVLGILAILVRFRLGTAVIFRQERSGLCGRPFTILKFRTMTNARDAAGRLRADAERLVPFGRSLRAASLDELPELWNVLKGEMSLVGPRPLPVRYLALYSPDQARRHEVRPGITGWAQVNGRNALKWDQKFRLDIWYVDNVSLWLDLKILSLTAWNVLTRKGISADGAATMPEFTGARK